MTTSKGWPYCEGHPHCHDSRTRRYAHYGTNGHLLPEGHRSISFTFGAERDPRWGQLLCRAHALIIWGVA